MSHFNVLVPDDGAWAPNPKHASTAVARDAEKCKTPTISRNVRTPPVRPSPKAAAPQSRRPPSRPQTPRTLKDSISPRTPSYGSRAPQPRPASRSSPAQTVDRYLGYAASNNSHLVNEVIQLGQWRMPRSKFAAPSRTEVFKINWRHMESATQARQLVSCA